MDLGTWIAVGAVLLAAVAGALAMPALLRDTRRRQERGAGGSLNGIGAGLDAVWRPSADEAHSGWARQVEVPAPAPTPGDKGGIDEGRLVIEVEDRGEPDHV